jgi:AcrR family transcriptional regulator
MSRPPNPETRARLRAGAVEYVLANGLASLSLRPLAKALDTSARMLVYHFGSRDNLLTEILAGVREREDRRIQTWLRSGRQKRTLADFITWYWRRAASPAARPMLRLIFELYALALRQPADYRGVLESPLDYWRALQTSTGGGAGIDPAITTLIVATIRGLLLDVAATGDAKRTNAALKSLVALVRSHEDRETMVRE